MCFAFVLAAIIQFASVHFFTKHGSGEIVQESDLDDGEEEEEEYSEADEEIEILTSGTYPDGKQIPLSEKVKRAYLSQLNLFYVLRKDLFVYHHIKQDKYHIYFIIQR